MNETSDYNDRQPVVVDNDLVEGNHKSCIYPKYVPLILSNEKLKCRTVRAVLRYPEPNPGKYPKKYAYHLLFTFYPFCNEDNLKLDGSYFAKLQQSGILDIINLNRQKLNPYNELVNNVLLNLQTEVKSNCDFNNRNDEIEQNVLNCVNSLREGDPSLSKNIVMSTGEMPPIVLEEELNEQFAC